MFQYQSLPLCQDLGWVVNLEKIRPESQAGLYLCRVPVLFCSTSGQIHHKEVAGPGLKNQLPSCKSKLLSQTFHVPDRSAIHNRETGAIRLPSHDAIIMAPEEQLAYSRIPGKAY